MQVLFHQVIYMGQTQVLDRMNVSNKLAKDSLVNGRQILFTFMTKKICIPFLFKQNQQNNIMPAPCFDFVIKPV